MSSDIKDLLYSAINGTGIEKIRMDIDVCEKYCLEILDKCKSRLGTEANNATLATLCEALLHFMLTVSLLPSERKVSMLGANLDVVIPSTRILAEPQQVACNTGNKGK